ncbi:DUF2750 domain-containing protein [Rheinheimera tangshanensis]|uniref:DUF2750 domain-containing protein n=1 Tax=Rheinheimera tangshanensis TaxID=400153 RepID=A0A5C8M750_9GAMM|nr:DUF2750 domain-containing protein [Rheinheimera tangshanensis]TXK83190.1 DUF2750 domain-containing protein [Rheinheimera tangshanensis]GGM45560.1 hypothetical protein GCM10010920_02350 [Rheinheimera tangshanensis]
MGQSASQAHAFYKDVAKNKKVWTIRDEGGYPAPKTRTGQRSQPFWSTLSRVQKIIKNVPAYNGFEPVELSWDEFRDKWLPGLTKDGLLVGVNWSGKNATGYDLDAPWVRECVEIQIKELANA